MNREISFRGKQIVEEIVNLKKCYRGDEDAKMYPMSFEDYIQKIADDDAERLAIVKKATVSGWKSFYKTTTKKTDAPRKKSKAPVKDMNNFKRREYDMDSLENQLLDN